MHIIEGALCVTMIFPPLIQGGFQLFIKARHVNDTFVDTDAIFVDRSLAVGTGATPLAKYTGEMSKVTAMLVFRVDCGADYYGEDCNIFCQDSSDPVNGFYTCDSNNGSRICNNSNTNPETFCTESEWLAHL